MLELGRHDYHGHGMAFLSHGDMWESFPLCVPLPESLNPPSHTVTPEVNNAGIQFVSPVADFPEDK